MKNISQILRLIRASWRGSEKDLDNNMDWGLLGDGLEEMFEE